MTDKKIIIDGIDVSGCNYYADGKCTNSHMIQSNCKNVAVCYYKQLKRKEEEYERLSSLIRKTQTYKDTCCNCRDDILLYPSISGRTNYTQIEVEERSLERIIQQLDQLKAENKRLDNELYMAIDEGRAWIEKFKQTLTEIKEIAKEQTKLKMYDPDFDLILNKINEVIEDEEV